MSFGEKLRLLRENAEMNQTELGIVIQATQRKVSYLECGKCEPSMEDVVAICKHFKISADYLLGLPANLKYPNK